MPAPNAYTEAQLAAYMQAVLGDIGVTLGWEEDTAAFDEPINDVLLSYGVEDVADALDIAKLRTIARREAWRAAVGSLAAYYDFSSDQERFQRSQMLTGAHAALAQAEADCAQYGIGAFVAEVIPVTRTQDPYVWSDDDSARLI